MNENKLLLHKPDFNKTELLRGKGRKVLCGEQLGFQPLWPLRSHSQQLFLDFAAITQTYLALTNTFGVVFTVSCDAVSLHPTTGQQSTRSPKNTFSHFVKGVGSVLKLHTKGLFLVCKWQATPSSPECPAQARQEKNSRCCQRCQVLPQLLP